MLHLFVSQTLKEGLRFFLSGELYGVTVKIRPVLLDPDRHLDDVACFKDSHDSSPRL
jgi:hypothetical protein